MTEENKENCNFQQNYNVFGLDDKPCCYLYHKYCDEIDNCYFKRCKRLEQERDELLEEIKQLHNGRRTEELYTLFGKPIKYWEELEQENKELKEKITSLESEIRQKKMTIMMNNDHYLTVDENNRKYRSALEEIKKLTIIGVNASQCNCGLRALADDILTQINEVLK